MYLKKLRYRGTITSDHCDIKNYLTHTTVVHNGVHVLQSPLLVGQRRRLDYIATCCCGWMEKSLLLNWLNNETAFKPL